MIIIEGPDLAGKTTLVEALADRLKWPSRHLSRLPDSHDRLKDYGSEIWPHHVQDRLHMSEVCYPYARGEREMRLTIDMYRAIDAQTRLVGAVNVVLVPTEGQIRARWGRDEMYDLDVVLRARRAYEMMVDNQLDGYRPDVDLAIRGRFPSEDDVEWIVARWKKREALLRSLWLG